MKIFDSTKEHKYVFGFEESYGCLIDTYARDKDAISAVMALCEATAYYKSHGLTLWDKMLEMYERYGYYQEGISSVTLEGANGAEKIEQIMTHLRQNPPKNIGTHAVVEVRDYKDGLGNLPKSNVLYYALENDGWCCVRPSGTEPKVKLYTGVKGNCLDKATVMLNELQKAAKELIK